MSESLLIINNFIANNPGLVTWGIAGLILLLGLALQISEIKEYICEWKLNNLLMNVGKDVLRNVTIPDGMDGDIFIEYLILTPKNILLLSVKKYKGLIFAAEEIDLWTQVVGNKSYKFNNPLLLLENDTLELKSKIESSTITEKVLFINGSEFPKGKPDKVVSIDDVKKWKNTFTGDISSSLSADWERLSALATNNDYTKGVLLGDGNSLRINIFSLAMILTICALWLVWRLAF